MKESKKLVQKVGEHEFLNQFDELKKYKDHIIWKEYNSHFGKSSRSDIGTIAFSQVYMIAYKQFIGNDFCDLRLLYFDGNDMRVSPDLDIPINYSDETLSSWWDFLCKMIG